jgi:hypothetical protein
MTELKNEKEVQKKSKWQSKMPLWRNPPTEEQQKKYFGNSLIALYTKMFNERVKKQPNFAELTLHCIIGQLPSVKKMRIHVGANDLDLRISGCFFKPSGSGGGRGFNFMALIAKEVGLNYRVITEITDAALIGTSSEKKAYNASKKGMVTEIVIERGALDPTPAEGREIPNILAMNEADILFSNNTSEFKKNAMLYYQIALNTMGTEDNKLAKKLAHGDWIEFNPNCSLMLMSYPPDSFYETIVKRGFLQRMIILYNVFSTQDRIDVAKELTMMLDTNTNNASDLNDLVNRLKFVDDFWMNKDYSEIKIQKEALTVLITLVDEFFKQFEGISEYPRKKLEEFSQRWIEHIWKISWHHMILRLDTTVTLEDVGYAKGYVIPVWKELIGLLEEGIIQPSDSKRTWKVQVTEAIRLYQSLLKKQKETSKTRLISRANFVNILATQDYWSVSYKTASTRIRRMEDEGIFERKYSGTAPMIQLSKLPKHMQKQV